MSNTISVSKIVTGSPANPAMISINNGTAVVEVNLSRGGYRKCCILKVVTLLLLKLTLIRIQV